jgi:hypothetical protein
MWIRWALFLTPVALVAFVVVPFLIDQPFSTQTPFTLAAAFAMRRWSPLVTAVGVVSMLALGLRAWPGARPLGRAGVALAVAVTVSTAWFARENPFEWRFNPLADAQYVGVADARFLTDADLVLSVTVGDDAAAYPIRQLAYHHLVNDRIGRTPAVVTY